MIKLLFIDCYDYDFNDNGRRVSGSTALLWDSRSHKLVKAKVVNKNKLIGKKFGDELEVTLIPNGRYLNYEV